MNNFEQGTRYQQPESQEENKERSKFEKTQFPTYFVTTKALDQESPVQQDPMALVAIDVSIKRNDSKPSDVVWFDSNNPVGFKATNLSVNEETGVIQFDAQQNGFSYTLSPLNPELYNKYVAPFMFDHQTYTSQEEMEKALLETKEINGGW